MFIYQRLRNPSRICMYVHIFAVYEYQLSDAERSQSDNISAATKSKE